MWANNSNRSLGGWRQRDLPRVRRKPLLSSCGGEGAVSGADSATVCQTPPAWTSLRPVLNDRTAARVLSGACLIFGLTLGQALGSVHFRPAALRCEFLENPLGIGTAQPRLSWVLEPKAGAPRGQRQSAYEILVASAEDLLARGQGDLWESGRVSSDASTEVNYHGKPLASEKQCFWKVRVWDPSGSVSGWSEVARWSVGLLNPGDWRGRWIGWEEKETSGPEERRLPARWLRKEFSVQPGVTRAVAYLSGLGLSELYLNGTKVSHDVLSPALSEYSKRAFYVTYDVTQQVKEGSNVIGVILGNGRFYAPRGKVPTETRTFGCPKLLFQMRLEYADGSSATVVSDLSWKLTTAGPIRANSEYDGEEYDARMELPGWDLPGCDDSNWNVPQAVDPPGGILDAQMIHPIRVTQTLKTVALTQPSPGTWIFDFGQNFVGWCRLRVSGPRGTTVALRHAETLQPDGNLYLDNIRSAKVTDKYTLKGKGREVYEPRFTYHGFRYVEVTGFPGKPSFSSLEGCVVNDDIATAGTFTSSSRLLDKIYSNVLWGVRGNYRSIPTDCPQRDERQGWLGDRSAECKGETYLFDTAALYAKWLQDMADAQKANGSVPDVCPAYWPIYSDNVTWPSSTVIIPGTLREQYGDTAIVAQHYESAKRWMDYMAGFITNGIIARDSYGDWCVPPEDPKLIHSNDPKRKTERAILATAYFYADSVLMAGYARLLGRTEDVQHFVELAERLKRAFNQRFLNEETGRYDNGSQTSCVLPLAFGLVPEPQKPRVFNHLLKKIEEESHGHAGTGLIGGQWLMRVLSDNGRPDVAYEIATQKTYPSWGYMVEHGATTIWELWNGDTADPAMNSGNHVMLVGDLVIWMHEYLAGIKPDPITPGFKHFIMHPEPVGDLKFVRATHQSPYGLIASSWKREGDRFRWEIRVPVNASATLYVPALSVGSVREAGHSIDRARGVRSRGYEKGRAVFEVGSGAYRFESTL
jgi:alpha-L-rhamnosidase